MISSNHGKENEDRGGQGQSEGANEKNLHNR
jgi:hypothetical protein